MIIGIAGQKGVGKSTIADCLVLSHRFYKLSFADPIKAMADGLMRSCGMSKVARLEHSRRKKEYVIDGLDLSFRTICQTLGTEWGREIDPDIWIKLMQKRLSNAGGLPVVIDDVRFENEAAWIREQGGFVLHVLRDTGYKDAHASELGVEIKKEDWLVYNNGEVSELIDRVLNLLQQALTHEERHSIQRKSPTTA